MIEKTKHHAVLAIWLDYAGSDSNALMSWYRNEHLLERTSVPGFVTGNKYAEQRRAGSAAETAPHFTFYEVLSMRPLAGGVYHERLNTPTPLTREIMPGFRRVMRTAMHVAADLGYGRGSHAATLRFRPADGRAAELETWLHQTLLPDLLSVDAILRCQFWQGDAIASGVESEEKRMRGGADGLAEWALLIEATDAEPLDTALQDLAPAAAFAGAGGDAGAGVAVHHYRFQFAVTNPASIHQTHP